MEVSEQIEIVAAERLEDGLVLVFQDGRCAFYSAQLLHAVYPQADALDEKKIIW